MLIIKIVKSRILILLVWIMRLVVEKIPPEESINCSKIRKIKILEIQITVRNLIFQLGEIMTNKVWIKMQLLEVILKQFILIWLKDQQKNKVHHFFKEQILMFKVLKGLVIVNCWWIRLIRITKIMFNQEMSRLADQKIVKIQNINKNKFQVFVNNQVV